MMGQPTHGGVVKNGSIQVGLVGLGMMGRSIARVFLKAGHRVIARDDDDASSRRLLSLLRQEWASKNDGPADLVPMTKMASIQACPIVIEAVQEDEECKRQVLTMIGRHQGDEAIIGTHTSSISITRLSAHVGCPERFIGLHFMKPPTRIILTEVVKGLATSKETCAKVDHILRAMGRKVVFSQDYPAFIVNRILMPMINEAITVLYQGVGSVEAIDQALQYGARHPMGPLQLADLIGLDLCASILQRLHCELSDDKYRPCPLLMKYIEAGWLGRKTNRGFYDYHGKKPRPTR